ncbi:MAG: 2OG-Fe(II) oxygenase [Deltaproteobacteria bacterium]|nr:2OG-Fe(II) oxygenase [Deltaproteobacteria bacterium]
MTEAEGAEPRVVHERSRPPLRVVDGLLGDVQVSRLRAAVSPERLAASGVTLNRDQHGAAGEVPVGADPVLGELAALLTDLIGIPNAFGETLRVRHAGRGHFHPLHLDTYSRGDAALVATAIVYLSGCEGGVTRFPSAEPSLSVAPAPGRVAVWLNVRADGTPEAAARHAIAPILDGERTTLAWFVYASAPALAAAWESAHAAPPGELRPLLLDLPRPEPLRGELTVITDHGLPDTTLDSLRRAAAAARVGYREVQASSLDPRVPPLEPGAMLFRPATTMASFRAERQLWRPGVATVHATPAGPFALHVEQWTAFARAGLPTPRSLRLERADHEFLAEAVEWLGGFPVVVRVDSGEGGDGVLLAESMPALRGLADLFVSRGMGGRMATFVPGAMHWRLIVVGGQVVTAYRNPTRDADFRSEPSSDPADYGLEPSAEMADLAVRATAVAGVCFAGVDVLEHPSGRLYLLEANFPCYFPQGEAFGAADVSGALIAFLLARRDATV